MRSSTTPDARPHESISIIQHMSIICRLLQPFMSEPSACLFARSVCDRLFVRRRPWLSQRTSPTSSVSCQARQSDSKQTVHSSSTTRDAAGRRSWGLTSASLSKGYQCSRYHQRRWCQIPVVSVVSMKRTAISSGNFVKSRGLITLHELFIGYRATLHAAYM